MSRGLCRPTYYIDIERDSHSQNQNKVLGMSLYPIETSARNLPDIGRKLMPRHLLVQIITVVTRGHTFLNGYEIWY